MGWYKRGWEAGLTTLDEWWFWSVQYHRYPISPLEMPSDYRRWTCELVDFVINVAKLDPTPFDRVGRLIDDHAGLSPKIGEARATLRDIECALDDAVLLKHRLYRAGITDKKPKLGRQKSDAVSRAEEMLQEGCEREEINLETGLSVDHISVIKCRMKPKT